MKTGDKVVYISDWVYGPIREGTLTKVGKELVFVDHHHAPEDCIFRHFVFPYEAKENIEAILKERRMLSEALDKSMTLVYQLGNKHSEWRRS